MAQKKQTLSERLDHRISYYIRKMKPAHVQDSTKIPAVSHEKGYSVIRDAIWGLHNKHYAATPFALLAEECCKYSGDIFLEVPSAVQRRASGKDILGVMALDIYFGSNVDIFVEDANGKSAEGMAVRLYAGITTCGERPDFNRFNNLMSINKRNLWSK